MKAPAAGAPSSEAHGPNPYVLHIHLDIMPLDVDTP
jgi:hypothetical protein